MRHRKHHTRLNRTLGHRTATLRNLTRSLVLQQDENGQHKERIETGLVKAKVLRSYVEKLITLGKKGTLHHRRQAFAILQDKEAVHRIFEVLAKRYATRPGGYTRILQTRRRMGDGCDMAFIEFIDRAASLEPAPAADQGSVANA
jgi:large subunit ribosomal protein L17